MMSPVTVAQSFSVKELWYVMYSQFCGWRHK